MAKEKESDIKVTGYTLPPLEDLLEAGVHFGHQTRRWHPKIAPYIYKEQNKIHIFDLLKTYEKLKEACDFLYGQTCLGKTVCFVGTKKQAAEIIKGEAKRCGAFFVSERWTGGMITNFDHVKNKMIRLKTIELGLAAGGKFEKYTKKERLDLERDMGKLEEEVGGVRNMEKVPDSLFALDIKKELTAVLEARKIGIPVVALVDSNCDPTLVKYPIPGNDDARRSLEIITKAVADAVEAGYKVWAQVKMENQKAAEKPEAPGDKPRKEKPVEKKAEKKAVKPKKVEEVKRLAKDLTPAKKKRGRPKKVK